jgi:leucyl/phenylalanyl-tRNA---protein transferase
MNQSNSMRDRGRFGRGLRRLNAVREYGAGKAQRLLGRVSTLLTRNPMGGECGIADGLPLNVDQMLLSYMQGLFPMDVGGKLRWRCPYPRFALPLAELRAPSDIERAVSLEQFELTFDRAPREVVDTCAQSPDGEWLSERLKPLYLELFELGVMHSVELWSKGQLVGGSFGLSLGRVWIHEARFERAAPAADAQFVCLARHLAQRGYSCIEGQVHFEIMARLGGRDMSVDEYRSLLARGLIAPASFVEPAAARA